LIFPLRQKQMARKKSLFYADDVTKNTVSAKFKKADTTKNPPNIQDFMFFSLS
jgi:hypothetical protein